MIVVHKKFSDMNLKESQDLTYWIFVPNLYLSNLAIQKEYWYGYDYYDTSVRRSLYINDVLYTFSNKYLRLNELNNLDDVGQLELIKDVIIYSGDEEKPAEWEVERNE